MKTLADANTEVYIKPQYLKEQLKKQYGTVDNKMDVVCFRDTASSFVNDAWYQNQIQNVLFVRLQKSYRLSLGPSTMI